MLFIYNTYIQSSLQVAMMDNNRIIRQVVDRIIMIGNNSNFNTVY